MIVIVFLGVIFLPKPVDPYNGDILAEYKNAFEKECSHDSIPMIEDLLRNTPLGPRFGGILVQIIAISPNYDSGFEGVQPQPQLHRELMSELKQFDMIAIAKTPEEVDFVVFVDGDKWDGDSSTGMRHECDAWIMNWKTWDVIDRAHFLGTFPHPATSVGGTPRVRHRYINRGAPTYGEIARWVCEFENSHE